MTEPFLLDCDTGVDDAMAILYLLADPNADVVAITNTFGNVAVEQTTENTLALLTLLDRTDVPVATGATKPLQSEFDGGAPHVHGDNGVGNVTLPRPSTRALAEYAPEVIVRMAHEHAGRLNIIAIGPLTNIALALRLEPQLPRLIRRITIMGGAVHAPGNVSPVAEANLFNDVHAAAEVLAAPWPITMVPLDVTMKHVLEESDRKVLVDSGRLIPRTMASILEFYFAFYENIFGRPCSALHDPLAVAIATGSVVPSLAPTVRAVIDQTDGPGRGQLICDLRGQYRGFPHQDDAHCQIVLALPSPFAPALLARVLTY